MSTFGLQTYDGGIKWIFLNDLNALSEHANEKRPCSREEFWIHAESTRVESRLAAVCSLRSQGERWNRTRVPRLWDQRSHSDDLLRSA